ncbi:aerobactin synthase [Marinobacter daqiaonensis]|uniref:Aerobactin synthase n=1 Tax=Marinobacter daqiaonensis TaxID=650891 RepID=A0A1I6I026_9GAMM|nr:IucA/IucC family protein [Marinobacter daqiaonensis]SFR60047.1 aerobactin synthase [Marinobacter daqiaonensis]
MNQLSSSLANWHALNRRLAAKIMAECSFEGCLTPEPLDEGRYRLMASGHCYDFLARPTAWGWLRIRPGSLTRNGAPLTSASELILDCAPQLAMDDITLGNFLEELNNTLAGDAQQQAALAGRRAAELLDLPAGKLEGLLDGHPKALASRGRLGWGQDDMQQWAPESTRNFRLRWLAVRLAEGVTVHGRPDPEQCLHPEELSTFRRDFPALEWALMPVHPWQWQRYIRPQYAARFASGDLVDLGLAGPSWRPQASIRTLSNTRDASSCDLKLSLTILNTSCYRGIPPASMTVAPGLSAWLARLVGHDPELLVRGLTVQKELGGIHVAQGGQERIPGTPYRYRETLAAVWRESLPSKTGANEQGFLLATLMQTDGQGQPLIAEMIRRSGLCAEDWVIRLFDRVTIPLYHLLCRYGIGLVAHGQNLGLILDRWRPARVVIKDFHGDLRAADSSLPERAGVPGNLLAHLTRLPPAHLFHDLYTGHLVTTLRFVSPLLEEEPGLPESHFYRLLAERVRAYQQQHPELWESFRQFDLLRPSVERVCINRARFRIGYGDDARRPLPELGIPLNNPLSDHGLSFDPMIKETSHD